MAVTFWEMLGSPTEGRDRGRYWAQRRLRVAWADRGELAELLIGFPRRIYPYAPATGARVDRVTAVPLVAKQTAETVFADHPGGTPASYEFAIVTVDYGTPRIGEGQPHPDPAHAHNPQQEIAETLEPYVETLPLPHRRFVWTDGSELTAEETPVKPVKRSKYVLTRKNQLTIPAAALDLQGLINAAAVTPVTFGGYVFPIHTLLMEPAVLSLASQLDGQLAFDITYRMLYRAETWRKHWRPKAGEVPDDGTGSGGSYQEIYFKPTSGSSPTQKYEMPAEGDFTPILPAGAI